MGSGFYSFEEAAQRLGKSKRSLYSYVKKGLIKKRTENGVVVLDREDVDLAAVEIGSDAPVMNRKTFFQMQSRLQKIENEMRAVMHALELRDAPPLRPNTLACLELIQAVRIYLNIEDKETHWTPTLVDAWADTLERIDGETLSSLAKAGNDQKAWIPFFQFCSELMDFCRESDRKIPSLAWQGRAVRLDSARSRLRSTIVIWLEMGRGVLPPEFLAALQTNKEALLHRIAKEGSA